MASVEMRWNPRMSDFLGFFLLSEKFGFKIAGENLMEKEIRGGEQIKNVFD